MAAATGLTTEDTKDTKREEGREKSEEDARLNYHTLQSLFEQRDVEINEQTGAAAREAEVGEQLELGELAAVCRRF